MAKAVKKSIRGMTLLEVLVAVFILAIVILPLINMFVTSTKFTTVSEDLTKTTYLAQGRIEELRTKTYGQLFNLLGTSPASNPDHAPYGGKFYTIRTAPAGAIDKAAFSGVAACYAHLFIKGGAMVFVGPDGKYASGSTADLTVTVSGSGYLVSGGVTASGTVPDSKPLGLIINCGSSTFAHITASLSGVAACAVYESPEQALASVLTVNGVAAGKLFVYDSDVPPGKVLVDATCLVYEAASSTTPQCVVQDTLEVNAP